MPQIESKLNPRSEDFKTNAAAMQAVVDDPALLGRRYLVRGLLRLADTGTRPRRQVGARFT